MPVTVPIGASWRRPARQATTQNYRHSKTLFTNSLQLAYDGIVAIQIDGAFVHRPDPRLGGSRANKQSWRVEHETAGARPEQSSA